MHLAELSETRTFDELNASVKSQIRGAVKRYYHSVKSRHLETNSSLRDGARFAGPISTTPTN